MDLIQKHLFLQLEVYFFSQFVDVLEIYLFPAITRQQAALGSVGILTYILCSSGVVQ